MGRLPRGHGERVLCRSRCCCKLVITVTEGRHLLAKYNSASDFKLHLLRDYIG